MPIDNPFKDMKPKSERHSKLLKFALEILNMLSILPIIAMLSFVGVIWLVMFVTGDLLGIRSQFVQILLTIFVMSGIPLYLFFRHFSFRCFRCRKLFFVQRYGVLPSFSTAKQCVHCGMNRHKPS